MRLARLVGLAVLLAHSALADEPEDPTAALAARIDSLRALGRYADAVGVAREVLELRRSNAGAKQYEVEDAERLLTTMVTAAALPEESQQELAEADRLAGEIEAAYEAGDYDAGIDQANRQLEIRARLLGDEHPDLAASLGWLASLLEARGDHAAAEPLYRQALAMDRKLLGGEHPIVGKDLNDLAILLHARGEDAEAERLLREALAMWRKLPGEEPPDFASSVNSLALVLQARGDLGGAEPLFRQALALVRKLFGDEHPFVASGLNNLAALLQARGDYAAAEPLYREALSMFRKLLGDGHPHVSTSLNNLAVLLQQRGDYAGAEPLFRESLAMRRKLSEEDPLVGVSLNNLALLLQVRGDYAEAEPLFRESLTIIRKSLGEEHPHVAIGLDNLAELLQARGESAEAELLFRQAIAANRRLFGEEHPELAVSLKNLALLLQARGDYAGAEPLLRQALAMRRRLLGEGHPYVAQSLGYLALLLRARGDIAGAEPLLVEAANIYDAARLRVGPGLSRATFQKSPHSTLAALRLTLGRAEEAWPSVERDAGRVLADLLRSSEERPLAAEEAAHTDSLKLALGDAERRLAAFRREARADTTREAAQRVEEARNGLLEIEAAWSAFQHAMLEAHPVTEGQAYPLERVQATLDRKSAILGWLDVDWSDEDHEAWGYVIRDRGPVTWAKLEPSAEPARALREELAERNSALPGVSRDAANLFAARVEPLLDALDGVRELLIIPSGPMSSVPVEALQDGDGTYLSERFTVSYIPSATVSTWLEEKRSRGEPDGPALIVGDPPFTDSQRLAMEGERPEDLLLAGADLPETSIFRSALAGNEEALESLPRLPGTRAEVRAVAALARSPTVLLGPEASEQEMVRLAGSGALSSFRTLHLATHALVDDERPENSALVLSRAGLPDPRQAAMDGTRIYDGLLTAKEILGEWKLGADLVTLSACETGLGKEIQGEGIVGFAHAFLQAGARSLLVSLWKADDTATSLLMQRFYENWWEKGMSRPSALQEAKRWLREYEDQAGRTPFAHPYFWSAFILIGERG